MSSDRVELVNDGPADANQEYLTQQPPPVYIDYSAQPPQYGQPQVITNQYPGPNTMVINEIPTTPGREPGSGGHDVAAITNLVLGIFTTLCCNFVCGIPAIVFASVAMCNFKIKYRRGFITAAIALNVLAILAGIISIILFFVLFYDEWLHPYTSSEDDYITSDLNNVHDTSYTNL